MRAVELQEAPPSIIMTHEQMAKEAHDAARDRARKAAEQRHTPYYLGARGARGGRGGRGRR